MRALACALGVLGLVAACGDSTGGRGDGDDDDDSCGDGVRQGSEICDGSDLGGATCNSVGFPGGQLGCRSDCRDYDRAACAAPETCGDGVIQAPELCDGGDLGGQTCEDFGLESGALACWDNCGGVDTNGCAPGDCTPDCAGRECGPDPACGVSCGRCDADETCNQGGQCVCAPLDCDDLGAECGAIDDGCGTELDCGGCPGVVPCAANQCMCPVVPSGDAFTVDVPVVDITFHLTIGGVPISPANTSDNDEGGLRLVHVASGETISLPEAAAGTTMNYPLTRRLVPGIYDIRYYQAGVTSFWPVNDNALLLSNVDLTTSQTLNVDVPVADITFALTVGGAALTPANTSDSDEGGLRLVNGSEAISLPEAAAGTTMNYPLTRRVVPGNYDIRYYQAGVTTFWPVNENALLMSNVNMTSSGTVNVNVPVANMTFALTVGGAALTPANTNDSDEGGLRLVNGSETISLPEAAAGTTMNYPLSRRVVPGNYDIRYYQAGVTTFWPVNDNALLMSNVNMTTSGTVNVNVPVANMTFALTVGGAALTPANTSDSDEGGLRLVNGSEAISLPEAAAGTTMNYPLTRRVVPGNYDIRYYEAGVTTFWPVNENALLMSNVNMTSSGTVNVNVPVANMTFALTVGGAALTPANTNDSDEGGLRLVNGSEAIALPEAAAGTTMNYPLSRRVVPGNYDIRYYQAGVTTFWPVNENALLMSNVDMTSSGTVNVNVPVSEITFALTVGGAAVTPVNTSDSDEGGLRLVNGSEAIALPEAAAGTTMNYPLTRRIMPGSYDVHYYQAGVTTFWPVNEDVALSCFTAQ